MAWTVEQNDRGISQAAVDTNPLALRHMALQRHVIMVEQFIV